MEFTDVAVKFARMLNKFSVSAIKLKKGVTTTNKSVHMEFKFIVFALNVENVL